MHWRHSSLTSFSLWQLLGLVLSTPALTYADTIHVPGDYPLIQDAINAATDGDVVLVAPGTYSGAGNINLDLLGKDISVESESGPAVTVIECNLQGRGFYIHSGETAAARVAGFTVHGGLAYLNDLDHYGGGFLIDQASPRIENCIIDGCFAGAQGGGIQAFGACVILDCIIRGNGAGSELGDGGYGAGMSIGGGARVERCNIESNFAHKGMLNDGGTAGGVGCAEATLEDCIIAGNGAEGGGGGVAGAITTLTDCLITGNSAAHGGGALAYIGFEGGGLTFIGCTIAGNAVQGGINPEDGHGGGISTIYGGIAELNRTIVWGNCSPFDGSDIFLDDFGTVTAACSDYDPVNVSGAGTFTETGPNIHADPLFCGPRPCSEAPTQLGDYSLSNISPCLPASSPCALLIGARDAACGPPIPVERLSWGRVKARQLLR